MALTTFGAIMKFAGEIASQNEEIYQDLIQKAKDQPLKVLLQELAGEEGKNRTLMERTRRENVTEMILEPITGLRQEEYEIQPKTSEPLADADILRVIVRYEERAKRFFQDASAKVPLPEVARTFRKVVQKKDENLNKLQGLGVNQALKGNT